MPFTRRGRGRSSLRRALSKASQKTKVRAIISQLAVARNTLNEIVIAQSSDVARANYFDVTVKPFSHIDQIEVDLALYQDGATVTDPDGFIDWQIYKRSGGVPAVASPDGTGLTTVGFTIRTGRAALPQWTNVTASLIYHLQGVIKIPPRHRIFAPGDFLIFAYKTVSGIANVTFSVNGVATYMFKV